jgi:DNA invertase Pin-like site-specific DNA recombinase
MIAGERPPGTGAGLQRLARRETAMIGSPGEESGGDAGRDARRPVKARSPGWIRGIGGARAIAIGLIALAAAGALTNAFTAPASATSAHAHIRLPLELFQSFPLNPRVVAPTSTKPAAPSRLPLRPAAGLAAPAATVQRTSAGPPLSEILLLLGLACLVVATAWLAGWLLAMVTVQSPRLAPVPASRGPRHSWRQRPALGDGHLRRSSTRARLGIGRRARYARGFPSGSEWPDPSPGSERLPVSERLSSSTPVIGYASVAAPKVRSNTDLRRQAEKIASACARRGLLLMEIVREQDPDRAETLERPGLQYALDQISAGEAEGLVVAELSRLTRSMPELGRMLEWLTLHDARLIAAAPHLDTDEEGGRLAVQTIIELSRGERERRVERTRNGMPAPRRKGPPGVADYPELRERIAGMRAEGMTLQAIADRLNLDGVPTVRGGAKWRPSSVQAAAGYRRPPAREKLGSPRRNGGS